VYQGSLRRLTGRRKCVGQSVDELLEDVASLGQKIEDVCCVARGVAEHLFRGLTRLQDLGRRNRVKLRQGASDARHSVAIATSQ